MITCKTPILKPIVWEITPDTTEEDKAKFCIWVITNACPARMGAVLTQGENWKTAHPATFMSKKFTSTQCAYFTYELEALGVLEALTKWLDELTVYASKLRAWGSESCYTSLSPGE